MRDMASLAGWICTSASYKFRNHRLIEEPLMKSLIAVFAAPLLALTALNDTVARELAPVVTTKAMHADSQVTFQPGITIIDDRDIERVSQQVTAATSASQNSKKSKAGAQCPSSAYEASFALWRKGYASRGQRKTGTHPCGRRIQCEPTPDRGRNCIWLN